ncbi:MAG: InlB B-repeat-containing protein [Bacteroidaceae bacterium]|nr:InlB B-repeat-containing protein [Bacteroidaceae bacterium]
MKRTTHLKSWLSIIMMLFMVGNAWGQANIHTSNVTLKKGTNAQDGTVKINDVDYPCMKIGTETSEGYATFNIPAGTKKICLHAAGWNNDGVHNLNITTSEGNLTTTSIPLTNDAGVSGDTKTYTLAAPNLAATSYYFEIKIEGVTSNNGATITLKPSNKRAIVWGINAYTNTYRVTYDANGATSGDVPIDNKEYVAGEDANVLGNTGNLERTGYTFDNWNTKADGTGTTKNPSRGEAVNNINSNVTLYAKWIPNKYNVTWYVNGSEYSSGTPSKEVYYGQKIEKLPTVPSDDLDNSLTFVGWTNEPIGESTDTRPSVLFQDVNDAPIVNITNDVNYYAVFAKQTGEPASLDNVKGLADIIDSGPYAILISSGGENYDKYLPNDEAKTDAPVVKDIKTIASQKQITGDMKWILEVETKEKDDIVVRLKSAANTELYLWGDFSENIIRVRKDSPNTNSRKEWDIVDDFLTIYDGTNDVIYGIYDISGTLPFREWYDPSIIPNVKLYKITEGSLSITGYTTHHIQVNVGGTGFSTLYYSDQNLRVPENVKATTYKYKSTDKTLEISKTYEASNVIPADEAVVIFSQEAFDKKATTPVFFSKIKTTTESKDANNVLRGTDTKTQLAGDNTCYFYALSRDKNHENVGFYWMNTAGSAFENGAHKAYLKLPKNGAAGIKAFTLDGDFETTVENISHDTNNDSHAIYNLSGQRVNKVSKGIFIKNGKKYIAK